MLTRRQALTRATDQLSANPHLQPTALPDAAVLLMYTLGISRAALIAHPEAPLNRDQQAAYQALLTRRLAFEPVQYILGVQEFFGHTLRVTPAVLIPRPETELLVEAVLARLPHEQPLSIADIGTGSGAIGIALAHALPQATVTALDLSPDALAVAAENARAHGLAERIRFVESDLFTALERTERFDAVVSNPPYIPAVDAAGLHPQVRDHEPAHALFAGARGMDIYLRLIPAARQRLKPNGLLALEFGFAQAGQILELLRGWHNPVILNDLQQIPRVALATCPD